jgi:DNA-directed RNA polymerase sigma subunit (sigma70/sigma32)
MAGKQASQHHDPDVAAFLDALADLDQALDTNIERTHRMRQRIREIQDALAGGRSLREVVPDEETPLLVELLTQSAEHLHAYGSRVRRTEARALHREGLTMEEIARLFGVTRQRVSALLRETSS